MRKNGFATVLMVFALSMLSGCASMHIVPDQDEDLNGLHARLDVQGNAITRTTVPTTKIETPMNMDRIPTLQRDIEEGRISGGLPVREEQEFQARLDSIQRDYLMMTEGGRSISCEERVDVSLRLNSLAREMERYR